MSAENRPSYDARKLFADQRYLCFGLVADTHLAHKNSELELLAEAYRSFARAGVNVVFHAGDLVDGWRVFRGQEFEQSVVGEENQINFARKKYPSSDKIVTLAIAGSHDLASLKYGGVNILEKVAETRKDIVYLGENFAVLWLSDNLFLELHHPGENNGEKDIFSFVRKQKERVTLVPMILAVGHFHQMASYLKDQFYQIFAPGFKKETGVTIGYWLIEVSMTSDLQKVECLNSWPKIFQEEKSPIVVLPLKK